MSLEKREKLIKFFANKDYAKAFLDGKLYFNTLGYYIRNGFEGQNDPFEGTICAVSNRLFPILPIQWGQFQSTDMRFRAVGYQYCNVLCFYRLGVEIDFPFAQFRYNRDMRKFGEYVIVVDNEEAFLQRVSRASKARNFLYVGGSVSYRTPKKDGALPRRSDYSLLSSVENVDLQRIPDDAITERLDSFVKVRSYADQNEWRITLFRGDKDESAYILDVGSLHDICHLVHINKLDSDLRRTIDHPGVKFLPSGYRGNTTREALRNAFYELGNYQATLMLTL